MQLLKITALPKKQIQVSTNIRTLPNIYTDIISSPIPPLLTSNWWTRNYSKNKIFFYILIKKKKKKEKKIAARSITHKNSTNPSKNSPPIIKLKFQDIIDFFPFFLLL